MNTIKYSGTNETNALNKGNWHIGVGDVNKGPTEVTGYYAGITPPENGYTIYLSKETQGPAILVCVDDNKLIETTNRIANSSYTTVAECLNYFATQDDKMVVNQDYEPIVTDGLVLNLDAGFLPSYPRTGTTWYDLSGNGNDGTLTNGPTLSSDNGGSIIFDGSNDYIRINHSGELNFNSSDFTATNWCRVDGNSGAYRALWQSSVGVSATRQFGIVAATNNKWGIWMTINDVWSSRLFSDTSVVIGEWIMVTMVYRNNESLKLYLNGVEDKSVSISGNLTYTPTVMNLGARFNTAEHFNGPIATGHIYNRALTSDEVQQNYNATKGRFGIQ